MQILIRMLLQDDFLWSLRLAEWLVVRTSDHKVLGLNPAGGRIQLMTAMLHFTEPIIITFPSSLYDLNNVEKEVKDQPIIIIWLFGVCMLNVNTECSNATTSDNSEIFFPCDL